MENDNAVNPEVVNNLPTIHGESNPVAHLVGSGAVLQRIENENLMQIAIQRPRDEAKVLNGALAELSLAPKFAKKAYYSIPYKDTASGKTTLVEGLSIKAAMALGRRWGNCTNGFRIIDEDAERVTLEGVFIDFETNMRTQRTLSVSKKQRRRTKEGKAYFVELTPDRLNIAIQAGGSKAVRNAILSSLPAVITEAYFDKAREVVGSKNPIEEVYKQFARIGITAETIAAYLKQPHIAGMSHTERVAHLIGIFNAVEEGQVTPEDAFDMGDSGGTPAPRRAEKAHPKAEYTQPKAEAPKPEPTPAPAPRKEHPAHHAEVKDAPKAETPAKEDAAKYIVTLVTDCRMATNGGGYEVETEMGTFHLEDMAYVNIIASAIKEGTHCVLEVKGNQLIAVKLK